MKNSKQSIRNKVVIMVGMLFLFVAVGVIYAANEAYALPTYAINATITDDTNSEVNLRSNPDLKLSSKGALDGQYTVKIVVPYDPNAGDKALEVTLKEGLNWVDDGKTSVETFLKEGTTIEYTGQSKNILGTTYSAKNGTKKYIFKDLTDTVTLNITIATDITLNLNDLADAITITSYYNNEVYDTVKASVTFDYKTNKFFIASFGYNGSSNVRTDSDISTANGFAGIRSTVNGSGSARYIIYKKNKITMIVPSNVIYKGLNSLGSTDNVDHKEEDNGDGTTTHIFTISNNYTSSYYVVPMWNIPSSNYFDGDEVTIKATKVEYEKYDGTIISENINYTNVFTISNNEDIRLTGSNMDIHWYSNNYKNDVGPLGFFNIRNIGGADSNEKEIVYNFDDPNTLVTGASLPIRKDETVTKIWYKKKTCNASNECVNDDTWYEKDISLSAITSNGYDIGYGVIDTNSIMSLDYDQGTYFTAIKYNLGSIKSNAAFVSNSTYYGYHGKILDDTVSTYTAKVRINDVGYDDTNIGETTNFITIKGNLRDKVLSTGPSEGMSTNIVNSGNTINFAYGIAEISRSHSIDSASYINNPIYYIRSETGLPITNIKLIGNDGKTDIISECEITNYTLDDGSLVYKIDTKNVKKNLAFVGVYRQITYRYTNGLRYSIVTPTTYNDGAKKHNYHDMIFVSDPVAKNTLYYAGLARNGDPYDVDKDGQTNDVMLSERIQETFYQIIPNTDINESNSSKKESESEYKYWNDGDSYTVIDDESVVDVKATIQNASGVKVDQTKTYIPIPKANENWGTLLHDNKPLQFSTTLTEKVSNPDSAHNTIYYCKNATPSSDISVYDTYSCTDTISDAELSSVNLIKIVSTDIADKENYDFVMKLKVSDSNDLDHLVDIYRPIYYRNLTNADGDVKSGYEYGNYMALETGYGKVTGSVYYDENQNNTKEAEENNLSGIPVVLYDKDNNKVGEVQTDTNGTFTFKELYRDPSNYYVVAGNEEYPTKTSDLLTATTNGTDIKIPLVKKDDKAIYNVTVHHYLEGTTTKLSEDVTARVKDEETYTPSAVSSLTTHYTNNTLDPVTIDKSDVELTYYYTPKTYKVTVHHYLKGTTQSVGEDEVITKKYQETYTTTSSAEALKKYDLASEPTNKTGTVTENVEVNYYYEKKDGAAVTVHHYVENTTTKAFEDDILTGKVDERYEARSKGNDAYIVVEVPANKEGTFTLEAQEVIYYYKLKNGMQVVVNYLDEDDEEITGSESVCEGQQLGTNCHATCKDIEGYNVTSEPPYFDKTIGKDVQEVSCKYEKKLGGGVTLKGQLADGTPIEYEEKICSDGKTGSVCKASCSEQEGYILKTKVEEDIVLKEENQDKICVYEIRPLGKVNVIYQDEEGNIIETKEVTGYVDDKYVTEEQKLAGYEIVEVPTNKEGTISLDETTVRYIYKKIENPFTGDFNIVPFMVVGLGSISVIGSAVYFFKKRQEISK